MMSDYLEHNDACRVDLDSVMQVALELDSTDILIAFDLEANETEIFFPANLDHMKNVKVMHTENSFKNAIEIASKMSKGVILYVTWGKRFNTEKEDGKRILTVYLDSVSHAIKDVQSVVEGPLVGKMVKR